MPTPISLDEHFETTVPDGGQPVTFRGETFHVQPFTLEVVRDLAAGTAARSPRKPAKGKGKKPAEPDAEPSYWERTLATIDDNLSILLTKEDVDRFLETVSKPHDGAAPLNARQINAIIDQMYSIASGTSTSDGQDPKENDS